MRPFSKYQSADRLSGFMIGAPGKLGRGVVGISGGLGLGTSSGRTPSMLISSLNISINSIWLCIWGWEVSACVRAHAETVTIAQKIHFCLLQIQDCITCGYSTGIALVQKRKLLKFLENQGVAA